jgi:transposase
VPVLPSSILEPLWDQLAALLPTRHDTHPLGCHRPRIPDRVIFDKLIQVMVFGCGYRRIADASCSASTLRRRRDEWITLGIADQLHQLALAAQPSPCCARARSPPTSPASSWDWPSDWPPGRSRRPPGCPLNGSWPGCATPET